MNEPRREIPTIALTEFAERLPLTMRDIVLTQCCLGFGPQIIEPGENCLAKFRAMLFEAGDVLEISYATAKMIGLMEVALERDGTLDLQELGRKAFEKTGAPIFGKMALGDPLRDRHWDAAYAEFRRLREGVLSPKALHQMLTVSAQELLRDMHRPRDG